MRASIDALTDQWSIGGARYWYFATTGASTGGVEQALTREWSIVAEYKYVDLGSASVGFAGTPAIIAPVATEVINQRYQVQTLGMNYKLN